MRGDHRIILGIDPGLANTGWGIVEQNGSRLRCLAYGCVSTPASMELSQRLLKIAQQIGAVVDRFKPTCVGIETVWFGQNITAAFSTGQARAASLVACAQGGLMVGEFTPRQIKLAVVGEGTAEKDQVQYMVKQILGLDEVPHPDHAAAARPAHVRRDRCGVRLTCCRGRLGYWRRFRRTNGLSRICRRLGPPFGVG